MSAHRKTIGKLITNTKLEDLIQNVKFCAHIHQIGHFNAIQARYNPDIAMDVKVADHMVELSSNTRCRCLCQ